MNLIQRKSPYALAALCAGGVFFVWGALTLGFYPPVEYNLGDEIWSVDSSLRYIESPDSRIITPRLYFTVLGLFLKASGWGIFGARFLSLVFACGVLGFVWLAARETGGEKTALAALALLASSYGFGWHARVARPEMLSALIIAASFWLLVRGIRRESGAQLLIAGFLSALAVHAHANCVVYPPAILAACLFAPGGMKYRKRLIPLVAGIAAGAALWYLWAYVPSARGTEGPSIAGAASVVAGNAPLLKESPLDAALGAFVRLPKDYLVEYPRLFNGFFTSFTDMFFLEYAVLLILAAGLFSPEGRKALPGIGFCLASAYAGYLLAPRFGYWHVIEIYPMLAVSFAHASSGIGDMLGGRMQSLKPVAPLVVITGLCALGIADTALSQRRFAPFSYTETLDKISSAIPEGGKATGRSVFGPAFSGADFEPLWFGIDRVGRGCGDFGAEARTRGIKYVIADPALLRFSSLSCGPEHRESLLRFLNLEATVAAEMHKGYPSYWGKGEIISGILIYHIN